MELHTQVTPRGLKESLHSLHHHPWDNPAVPSLRLGEWFGVSPKFIWVHKGSINYQVSGLCGLRFFILGLHKLSNFFLSISKVSLNMTALWIFFIFFSHLELVWTTFISQVGFAVFFSQRKIHKRSFGLLRIFCLFSTFPWNNEMFNNVVWYIHW